MKNEKIQFNLEGIRAIANESKSVVKNLEELEKIKKRIERAKQTAFTRSTQSVKTLKQSPLTRLYFWAYYKLMKGLGK